MKYLAHLLKHKWFVFQVCIKLGVPLTRGVTHDLSKFTPAELPHYNRQFFGDKGDPEGYARAWLHHYHHNDHHWEYWVVESIHSSSLDRDDCIENNCLPMPYVCVQEMIADWLGASKAHTGSWSIAEWLYDNLLKIKMHPETLSNTILVLFQVGYRVTLEPFTVRKI